MADMHGTFVLKIDDDERRHLAVLLGAQSKSDLDPLGLDDDTNTELYRVVRLEADDD
jgi:hypothetical protein